MNIPIAGRKLQVMVTTCLWCRFCWSWCWWMLMDVDGTGDDYNKSDGDDDDDYGDGDDEGIWSKCGRGWTWVDAWIVRLVRLVRMVWGFLFQTVFFGAPFLFSSRKFTGSPTKWSTWETLWCLSNRTLWFPCCLVSLPSIARLEWQRTRARK